MVEHMLRRRVSRATPQELKKQPLKQFAMKAHAAPSNLISNHVIPVVTHLEGAHQTQRLLDPPLFTQHALMCR